MPDANGTVQCLAVQPDASLLIGGNFTTLQRQPRNRIGRLTANSGSLDAAFDPNANGAVNCMMVQPDRRILVGGEFTTLGGQPCGFLGRLQTNGVVDPSFRTAVNAPVHALAAQPDGKLLVAGAFTMLDGQPRERIGRLMPGGSLDQGFCPTANGPVNCLVVQVDGKIVLGGEFTMLGGQPRGHIGRLNRDGSLDPTFDPPANGVVRALALQPDGRILVGGAFTSLHGSSCTNFGRLHPDGSLDESFDLPANGAVACVKVQSDNKILLGGAFTSAGGISRNHLARVYLDGSVDATMADGTTGFNVGFVPGLAVQADGKILLGGNFTRLSGESRKGIARLRAGGSLDNSFAPSEGTNATAFAVLESGGIIVSAAALTNRAGELTQMARLNADGSEDESFDASVPTFYSMALQPDGKIVVGGLFGLVGGQVHRNIVRLNFDGSVDDSFNASTDNWVMSPAVQPDGKILLGGWFGRVNDEPRSLIARLNADGSLDSAFNPGARDTSGGFSPPRVETLVVQPDGKILVGGWFITLAGQPRDCLGRLNQDGSLDAAFVNPRAQYGIRSLVLQTDGKIVVGGDFTSLGGLSRPRIARVNPDGSPDPLFNPGADYSVSSLAMQDDGKILVTGLFTNIGGLARPHLARLTSGSAARQSLEIDPAGTTVTWSRSGVGPEVAFVSYEISENGIDYDFLAVPTRIAGGWQQTGLSLPVGQPFFVRARGRVTSGRFNASRGIIESVAQFYLSPPSLTRLTMESNGTFRFAFSNSFATAFTVLASTNASLPVAQWEVLGAPVPVGGGLYEFTDPVALSHRQRFYQLRSQ